MRFNVLHLILLVGAMLAAMVATASHAATDTKRLKGWTLADHNSFMDVCDARFIEQAKASHSKYDVKFIHNLCDCMAGEIQYKLSFADWVQLDNQRPLQQGFLQYMTNTVVSCLSGSI